MSDGGLEGVRAASQILVQVSGRRQMIEIREDGELMGPQALVISKIMFQNS